MAVDGVQQELVPVLEDGVQAVQLLAALVAAGQAVRQLGEDGAALRLKQMDGMFSYVILSCTYT